jgi:hypothetical protein
MNLVRRRAIPDGSLIRNAEYRRAGGLPRPFAGECAACELGRGCAVGVS